MNDSDGEHEQEEKKDEVEDVAMSNTRPSCAGKNKTTIRLPASTRWGTRHGMCEDLLFFRDPIEVFSCVFPGHIAKFIYV